MTEIKGMKITHEQIMSFYPCYDPKEIGMPDDYEAELKDFIVEYKDKVKNLENIIWVCCKKEFFNERDLRLFGVWSALQVKSLMKDKRSLDCLEVSEKFAFDEANQEELQAARDAARGAAYFAAAARDAAWDAACAAARAAAGAAWVSAWVSAWDSAYFAARDSARTAAWDTARDSSYSAAVATQIQTLLKMIEKPNGEWFKEWKGQQ